MSILTHSNMAAEKIKARLKNGARATFAFLYRWQTLIAAGLIVALIISVIATYAVFRQITPTNNNADTVIWLLNVNLSILLMLSVILVRRIVALWSGRKRGLAGSHLHVRLVYTFSILAAAPAIIMTIFSAFFFQYGLQSWFSERIQSAVNNSSAVAQAYLEEHKQSIAADARIMANNIDNAAPVLLRQSMDNFETFVRQQSFTYDLPEAIIFDTQGNIFARSGLTFSLEFQSVPTFALRSAMQDEIVILTSPDGERVRALIKLRGEDERFLYVGRMIDPEVLAYLSATQTASEDYKNLKAKSGKLQISFIMVFVVIGLLLLMIAVWLGLILARQLIEPISSMIRATDQLRSGDYAARMPVMGKLEEFDLLAQAFNRMTEQIQSQQGELLQANRQLNERRRLIENVLKGVSSGVLRVDVQGIVRVSNDAARILLCAEEKADGILVGHALDLVLPGGQEALKQAQEQPGKIHKQEFTVPHTEKGQRTYSVRIAVDGAEAEGQEAGAIVTIEDITDLQKAQKTAAWADVARRIAHEIKNPLTPIQLSAERLKKKYAGQIKTQPEIFEQCTETIVKHVEDIGRMVSEFSNFARMPEPNFKPGHLDKIIEETLTLQKQAHPKIDYSFICTKTDLKRLKMAFDHQQMRQVFNNLLQNAADSVQEGLESDKSSRKGMVSITVIDDKATGLHIVVNDNGPGFPEGYHPTQLLEPYTTHKVKGTGLGLAIVKKILDDHKIELSMGVPEWLKQKRKWKNGGGATIILTWEK